MTQRRLNFIPLVLCLLAAALAQPAAAASCKPDYGKKTLRWVENDVERQSRELAAADYEARAFNTFLIGFEDLHRRAAEVSKRLDRVEQAIQKSEASIATGGAASREPAVARALLRDADSASVVDQLYSLRTELATIQDLRARLVADPTAERFRALGLQNVGRGTLVASLQEVGDLSKLALSDRYGVYVGVTFNDDGTVRQTRLGSVGDAYDGVALAGSAYAGPYSPLVYGAYSAVRSIVDDEDCRRKRKAQDQMLDRATRLLPTKVIQPDEQFALYDRLYRERRATFQQHADRFAVLETGLVDRWKAAFAYNAARSASARTVLTTAKVDQLRRTSQAGGDWSQLFERLGAARLTVEVGELGRYQARLEVTGLAACRDTAGLTALERNEDAVSYADEVLTLFDGQPTLAPVQPLVSARRKVLADARDRAGRRRAALADCGAPPSPMTTDDAVALVQLAALDSSTSMIAGSAEKGAFRATRLEADRVKALDLQAVDLREWNDFCVLLTADLAAARCGAPGGQGAYGDQFDPTGNPERGILGRVNDGGYRADARVSAGVNRVFQNVEQRIRDLHDRSGRAATGLPDWLASNTLAVTNMEAAEQVRVREVNASQASFQAAAGPATAEAEASLRDFLQSPLEAASTGRLVRAAGLTELSLPRLAAAAVPHDAPQPGGITALDRAYGPDASALDRQIASERAKIERDLAGHPLRALAMEAVEAAELLAGGGSALTPSAQALLQDAASIRFLARGELPGLELAVVQASGELVRQPVLNSDQLPPDTLVMRVRGLRASHADLRARLTAIRTAMGDEPTLPQHVRALDLGSHLADRLPGWWSELGLPTSELAEGWAVEIADLAVSVSPFSWPKDAYEALSGDSLLTGEPLDGLGHAAAIFGAVTAGVGDSPLRAIHFLRKAANSEARVFDAMKIVRADPLIDQGIWDNMSTHARKSIMERPVSDESVERALNEGIRYFDVSNDSILCIERGDGLRTGVAVSWRDLRIKTVIAEAEPEEVILGRTFTRPDGTKVQKHVRLPEIPGLESFWPSDDLL